MHTADLMGKTEGNGPQGRARHRWNGNMKLDLKKTVEEAVESVHLAENMDMWQAVVNVVKNRLVP